MVPLGIPRNVAGIRRRWDTAAQAAARPHVTVVYPFLPCPYLGPSVRATLADLAGSVAPSEVVFARMRRWPRLVWIEPEPAAWFARLTSALVERWPDHPPYGGLHEALIPHLTVVESDDDSVPFDEVEDITARALPFTTRAERMELWCQDPAGRWRLRWRMPFGVRP